VTQASITIKLPPLDAERLRRYFADNGFEMRDAPYAFWQGRGVGCIATFYTSGKLLLQGPEAEVWRAMLGEEVTADARPFHAALAKHPKPPPPAWIGTDEAGKGDYFGPLVVAGVRLERSSVEILATLGVADSKTLTDARMGEMVAAIQACADTEVLVIGPAKYNELYARMGNLNRMLAWAHGKVIENLLERGPAPYVVVDKFADEQVVHRGLGPKGREARVDLRTKAEDDPAVAAASVLARAAYVRGVRALSRRFGVELWAGAGPPTLKAGRELVAKHGRDVLAEAGKLHFATTEQITRGA
jgi:ribonuclease HIII